MIAPAPQPEPVLLIDYFHKVYKPEAMFADRSERTYATGIEWFGKYLGKPATADPALLDKTDAFGAWLPAAARLTKGIAEYYQNAVAAVLRHIRIEPQALPSTITLAGYLEQYVRENPMRPVSLDQMQKHVTYFDRASGRSVLVAEMNDDLLNGYIEQMHVQGLAQASIRGRRQSILTLWRAAFRDGLANQPPNRVRKIKHVPLPVVAWTAQEVARLLQACQLLSGCHGKVGIPWREYFTALVCFSWDTGLRPGDVFSIRMTDLAKDGSFTIPQSKTGWPKYGRIHPETLAAIDATIPPMREFLFPLPFSRMYFSELFLRLVKYAGIRPGSMKFLRRSGATDVEKQKPGAGSVYLGHRLPGIAGTSYLDMQQISAQIPLPTKLTSVVPAEPHQIRAGQIFDRKLHIATTLPAAMLNGKEESDHDFTD